MIAIEINFILLSTLSWKYRQSVWLFKTNYLSMKKKICRSFHYYSIVTIKKIVWMKIKIILLHATIWKKKIPSKITCLMMPVIFHLKSVKFIFSSFKHICAKRIQMYNVIACITEDICDYIYFIYTTFFFSHEISLKKCLITRTTEYLIN